MNINPQLAMLFAQLAMQAAPSMINKLGTSLESSISSIMPEKQPVFGPDPYILDEHVGPYDDPNDWTQDWMGKWHRKPGTGGNI